MSCYTCLLRKTVKTEQTYLD